jgi:hypothetical protein
MVGYRPGAMVALRNQLIRQSNLKGHDSEPQTGAVLVSGSVPVQHRIPRPVPLPQNLADKPLQALQPWASFFDVTRNHLHTQSPADQAFFAAHGNTPARGVGLVLRSPEGGVIPTGWDGSLVFDLFSYPPNDKVDWQINLSITGLAQTIAYEPPAKTAQAISFRPKDLNQLQGQLQESKKGSLVTLRVQVKPKDETAGLSQTLTFPLRVMGSSGLPLPLQPHFIEFEDPEYNRRLASTPAQATGFIQTQKDGQPVLHTLVLAVDRREYNPDSVIALRYDWDDNRADGRAKLQLSRIRNGQSKDLTFNARWLSEWAPQTLQQLPLLEVQNQQLEAGDALRFTLTVKLTDTSETTLVLTVAIVAQPVTPVPEAAYALLRQQIRGGKPQVECVRFAWGPNPSRVDLVCADDLRTEVVRRRGVFQWQDTARRGGVEYGVQKLTPGGSTHFPFSG